MTQSEVQLQLNEMNPSLHSMTPTAVGELVNENARNAQYAIDSATRAPKYVAAGGDPQQFAQWNQKYFPRQTVVNAGITGGPIHVTSRAEALKLPPGTTFIAPDGRKLVRQ